MTIKKISSKNVISIIGVMSILDIFTTITPTDQRRLGLVVLFGCFWHDGSSVSRN